MNSYYIHYTPLNDRLTVHLPLLLAGGLAPKLVAESNAESSYLKLAQEGLQNPSDIRLKLSYQISVIYDHLKSNLFRLSPGRKFDEVELSRFFLRSIIKPSLSTIEHTCQHIYCLKDGLNTLDKSPILVLEDDAVPLMPNFRQNLNCLMSQPEFRADTPFFIDLGQGLGLRTDNSNEALYTDVERVQNGRTRCSYAYIISHDASQQLLNLGRYPYFLPFMPSDWYLSLLLTFLEIPTYWLASPIFEQGSETGSVKSNQFNRVGLR